MPRRHAVESLPGEQLEWLLKAITNGGTDRAIAAGFHQEFKVKLSKSALHRWRKAAGDELADRYRFVRLQARQLVEDLKDEGADKHDLLISNIEDRLLTAAGEIISQDPIKLLGIQQEERRQRLRERELKLKERTQQFVEDQAQRATSLQVDRFRIAAETWNFILAYVKEKKPATVDVLTELSTELLPELETHIENQTA
jgi:hypothetical protein